MGTDLFKFHNKTYILLIDYYSKYIEIVHLKDESATTTIKALKSCFARWGIPKIIRSDNGPQFSSRKFKQFAKTWNFKHVTSSPTYLRSNSMVERQIQTIKRTLKKAFYDKKDPYLVKLELMNTPIAHDIKSPNQILIGRDVSGVVPDFLSKNKWPVEDHKQKLKKQQENQKRFHDRRARDLPELQLNQNVRVQKPNGQWERAIVVDKNIKIVWKIVYTIKTEDNKTLTRNRIHLSKDTDKALKIKSEICYDDYLDDLPTIPSNRTQENETQEILKQPANDNVIDNKKNEIANKIVTRSRRMVRRPN